jgi:hypothetical protein
MGDVLFVPDVWDAGMHEDRMDAQDVLFNQLADICAQHPHPTEVLSAPANLAGESRARGFRDGPADDGACARRTMTNSLLSLA